MSKFTFIRESDPDNWETESLSTISVTFTDFRLQRMLEEFENFLRASGFHFDGHLEIREKDEEVDELDDLDNLDEWFDKDKKDTKKAKNK